MYVTISLDDAIALLGEKFDPNFLGYMFSVFGQTYDIQLFPELKVAEVFSTDPFDVERLKKFAQRGRVKVLAAFC